MRGVAVVVCALSVLGSEIRSDDLPRKWVEPEDGFVWPKAVVGGPKFEKKARKVAELEEEFRKIAMLAVRGHEEVKVEEVTIAEVDLDGDGVKERFLEIPRFGGTGGTFFFIYTKKEEGWRGVGHMQVVDAFLLEKKNGWFQIESHGRGGPMDYSRVLHTFQKGKYVMTRLENHDLWKKTMVVRKLEKK